MNTLPPRTCRPALTLGLSLGLLAATAHAGVIWDESVNGDLSGDRLAPSVVTLSVGSNDLLATSSQGDREYLTFAVPAGHLLSSVILDAYAGNDGTAFFGLQSGTTFTEPASGTNPGNLLGWAHFGFDFGRVGVGQDLLPVAGAQFGVIGFTPPLPAGNYAVWLQQTSTTDLTSYTLDFVVTPVPEPAAAPLAAGALLLGTLAVRRLRR